MELIDFLNYNEVQEYSALEIEPKERIQRIVYTLQNEVNNSKIENLGMVLNIVLNIDKYKKMLSTYSSLMNNKNPLSDPNTIMNLMETFMEGSSEKDKEKIKEMSKMMDIIKLLDTPKKDKPNEI
jgi:Fic family protein